MPRHAAAAFGTLSLCWALRLNRALGSARAVRRRIVRLAKQAIGLLQAFSGSSPKDGHCQDTGPAPEKKEAVHGNLQGAPARSL